ncbi:MAG: succinate dehydrogenase [Planctomycetota bacterium]|nr:MAG: succinate dehydrogenase [Planctomycetota bacterium]
MPVPRERMPIDRWQKEKIPAGESRDVALAVSESYSGMTVQIPIQIRRAAVDGPVLFVTAALHGDEINGTGAIRQLIHDESLRLKRGAVIFVPVLNLPAFERHSRYLPDRRDLNRCFPGSVGGSLASRMARTIFTEIVSRCDYGIDLHTAAVRRTNYPTVRGDMARSDVNKLARAFGSEIIINGKGPKGAFRREACRSGCPTIILEAGEVWKVEPTIVETAARGIKNVLKYLEMLDGPIDRPDDQVVIQKTKWIRADRGGFLRFHVKPGEFIEAEQPLATNADLLGHERSSLHAPFDAVVLGMTTLPAVSPGEPVCHLGRLPPGSSVAKLRRLRSRAKGLEERVVDELASNVLVVERDDSVVPARGSNGKGGRASPRGTKRGS